MASDSEGQRSQSVKDEAAAEPARTLRIFPPVERAGEPADGDRARLKLVEDVAADTPEPDYEKVPLEVLSGTAARTTAPEDTEPVKAKRCRLPSTPVLIALAGAAVVLVSVPFLITEMWDAPKAGGEVPVRSVDGVPALVAPTPGPVPGQPVPGASSAPGVPGGVPASGQPGLTNAPMTAAGQPNVPPGQAGALVAGAGCANTARASYQKVGEYAKGREGWNTYQGGSADAGCSGVFDAMPMAGNSDGSPDPQTYTRWLFDVSGTVTAGRCAVSVYIPNDSNIEHVGAVKAHYSVFRSQTTSADNVVGVADIDQTAHLGQWVSLGGPFKVDTGKLAVKLNNSGIDWNTSDGKANYRHIASTQLKVSCSPS
ncbi:hypothetical protein [Amycolatopsis sp. NPDC059021]|uniref:hypothetical protein n=1 Tax=Amycolatopsis sp. NPDC059021 TaxID=3346704 RepID=UPI00366F8F66